MSSREIAKLTEKRHDNIVRDIRNILNELKKDSSFLSHQQYQELKDTRGYTKEFLLDKELTTILVSGYSVIMRAKIVRRWQELETQPPQTALPPQYVRYLQHITNVPIRHFCAMELVYNGFIGKLSLTGHDLLERLMPDGSFSRMFGDTLRKDGINPKTFPTYRFCNLNGYHGFARAYPARFYDCADEYLHDFWLPAHAPQYLRDRDRVALQRLPVALPYLVDRFTLPDRRQKRLF
jgi:hypothetical protein